jgi:hypothetical protein
MTWFEDGREQTGVMLLRRLQTEHPGVFDDNLLRTLQRRLGQWRAQKAQQLVFGVDNSVVTPGLRSLTEVLVKEGASVG